MARLQELRLPGSSRALLLLALASGLVAAVLVFVAVNSSDDDSTTPASPAGDVTAVVVASQDISAGSEITAEMVKSVDVPVSLVVKNAITDSELVVGETARFPISEGEQLVKASFGAQSEEDALAYVVPKGKRAISLSVEEVTAVGGLLRSGDRVDVIAVFDSDRNILEFLAGPAESRPTTAVIVLQDVEILAIAQEAQEPIPALDEQAAESGESRTSGLPPDDQDNNPGARTVTLALDPGQAVELAAVQQDAARIFLALRGVGDSEVGEGAQFDVSSLIP
jgi:pilus assembly protein CpaB